MPKVSCIMTTFNSEKYVLECIESILSQTYNDFEFIISDGGSKDKTVEIIKSYMKKDKRIILIENNKKTTIAESLNQCLEKCSGEYIAIMESDDISEPERFRKEVEFLDGNKNIGLVGSRHIGIDEKGCVVYEGFEPIKDKEIKSNQPIGLSFSTPSIMFRKEILIKTGKFKDVYRQIRDVVFFELLYYYDIKLENLKDFLSKKRCLDNSARHSNVLKAETSVFLNSIKLCFGFQPFNFLKYYRILLSYSGRIIPLILIKITKKIKIYSILSPLRRKYILRRNKIK